eukprot:2466534-Amphidinium_carterae.1
MEHCSTWVNGAGFTRMTRCFDSMSSTLCAHVAAVMNSGLVLGGNVLSLEGPEIGWGVVLTGNTPPPDLVTATTERDSALRDRAIVANHGALAALLDSVSRRSASTFVVALAVPPPAMSQALDTDPGFSRLGQLLAANLAATESESRRM